MNIVVLKGNLTRDPESRKVTLGEGKETTVVNFTIATNRHFRRGDGSRDKEVTFVDCEAWDSGADTICKYVHRGDPILVRGALKLDQWETDGQKRSKLKVRVNEFELLYRAPNDGYSTDGANDTPAPEQDSDPAAEGENIPF